MPEGKKYKTIVGESSAEFRDRGSKFLAFAYPVLTLEQTKMLLRKLKSAHPKAAHHCLAFRLGHDGNQYKAADDGEPAGTAGRPILGAIDSAGLTNVMVVVVRYFGGTLLGVPGLIHAYGSVAAESLRVAEVAEHWIERNATIECNYPALGEVLYILKKHEATLIEQDFQLFCRIQAGIPMHLYDACTSQLSEIRDVRIL